MQSNENIIGIYKITSPSGKVYIGQSTDCIERQNNYRRNESKKQVKIYRSILKYGWETHKFEILEECLLEQLDEKEQYYKQIELNKVNSDWEKMLFCHLIDGKGGLKSEETRKKMSQSLKGKKHSEESKQKMRKPRPGSGDKISKSNLGRKNSEIAKQNISKSKKGKNPFKDKTKEEIKNIHIKKGLSLKNKPKSEEFKKKLRKSIDQFTLSDEFIRNFSSINEASLTLKLDKGYISKCCKENHRTYKGFKFKYHINE